MSSKRKNKKRKDKDSEKKEQDKTTADEEGSEEEITFFGSKNKKKEGKDGKKEDDKEKEQDETKEKVTQPPGGEGKDDGSGKKDETKEESQSNSTGATTQTATNLEKKKNEKTDDEGKSELPPTMTLTEALTGGPASNEIDPLPDDSPPPRGSHPSEERGPGYTLPSFDALSAQFRIDEPMKEWEQVILDEAGLRRLYHGPGALDGTAFNLSGLPFMRESDKWLSSMKKETIEYVDSFATATTVQFAPPQTDSMVSFDKTNCIVVDALSNIHVNPYFSAFKITPNDRDVRVNNSPVTQFYGDYADDDGISLEKRPRLSLLNLEALRLQKIRARLARGPLTWTSIQLQEMYDVYSPTVKVINPIDGIDPIKNEIVFWRFDAPFLLRPNDGEPTLHPAIMAMIADGDLEKDSMRIEDRSFDSTFNPFLDEDGEVRNYKSPIHLLRKSNDRSDDRGLKAVRTGLPPLWGGSVPCQLFMVDLLVKEGYVFQSKPISIHVEKGIDYVNHSKIILQYIRESKRELREQNELSNVTADDGVKFMEYFNHFIAGSAQLIALTIYNPTAPEFSQAVQLGVHLTLTQDMYTNTAHVIEYIAGAFKLDYSIAMVRLAQAGTLPVNGSTSQRAFNEWLNWLPSTTNKDLRWADWDVHFRFMIRQPLKTLLGLSTVEMNGGHLTREDINRICKEFKKGLDLFGKIINAVVESEGANHAAHDYIGSNLYNDSSWAFFVAMHLEAKRQMAYGHYPHVFRSDSIPTARIPTTQEAATIIKYIEPSMWAAMLMPPSEFSLWILHEKSHDGTISRTKKLGLHHYPQDALQHIPRSALMLDFAAVIMAMTPSNQKEDWIKWTFLKILEKIFTFPLATYKDQFEKMWEMGLLNYDKRLSTEARASWNMILRVVLSHQVVKYLTPFSVGIPQRVNYTNNVNLLQDSVVTVAVHDQHEYPAVLFSPIRDPVITLTPGALANFLGIELSKDGVSVYDMASTLRTASINLAPGVRINFRHRAMIKWEKDKLPAATDKKYLTVEASRSEVNFRFQKMIVPVRSLYTTSQLESRSSVELFGINSCPVSPVHYDHDLQGFVISSTVNSKAFTRDITVVDNVVTSMSRPQYSGDENNHSTLSTNLSLEPYLFCEFINVYHINSRVEKTVDVKFQFSSSYDK